MSPLIARRLPVPGAWTFEAAPAVDARGRWTCWFQESTVRRVVGRGFRPVRTQVTVSVQGALRGIKYSADQAKYVFCVGGSVLDVVVDLRVGSPTFGTWHAQRLDADTPTGIYVGAGIGHAALALAADSTMVYLLGAAHEPDERSVHPLDPDLGIAWPRGVEPILSDREASAPGLREAHRAGLLPPFVPPPVPGRTPT